MIEFIAFTVFSIVSILLVGYIFVLRNKNKLLVFNLAQSILDYKILSDKFEELPKDSPVSESKAMIEFLESTRNSAFEYIEDVQNTLTEFVKDIGPIIDYHDKYGGVMGETMDWQNMERVSKQYKQILKLLPNDGEQK